MEGIIVVNSYSAPGELQQQAEAILATMESHHMAHLGWVVAGDHNDLPDCSVLVQVLQAAHQAVVVGVGQGHDGNKTHPVKSIFSLPTELPRAPRPFVKRCA